MYNSVIKMAFMGHVIMEPVSFITSRTHFILKASTCEKIEKIRVVHAFDESMGDYISQNKRSITREVIQ